MFELKTIVVLNFSDISMICVYQNGRRVTGPEIQL